MVKIFDKNGRKVITSKNLRGILDYARKNPVTSIVANESKEDTSIIFSFYNGATCPTTFASFNVLVGWVANRRSWGKVTPVITGESPNRKAEWNY